MTLGAHRPGVSVRAARSLALALCCAFTAAPWCAPPRAVADDGGTARQAHALDAAQEILDGLVPHVVAVSGASFTAALVLDAASARAVFTAVLRDEIERRHAALTPGQRLALLQAQASSSVASCLARYSFSRRAIVLVRESFDAQRGGAGFEEHEARDLLAAVLAHEAVHALDDERFDLDAFYAAAPDDEALRARAMSAEGRAVHLARLAAARAGVPGRARTLLPGGDRPRDAHAWTLRLTYELGAAYVADERAPDGRRLFDAPPGETLAIVRPDLAEIDGRPREILSGALADARVGPLSALQLRARYAALLGPERSGRLFARYAGGAQALVHDTNVVVLAFETEDAAEAYRALAADDAPTRRSGTLVVRAFGPAAETLLADVETAANAAAARRTGDEDR